jgi:hypothetical protein
MDHLQIMLWKLSNKNEIINTETADQKILDSDDRTKWLCGGGWDVPKAS